MIWLEGHGTLGPLPGVTAVEQRNGNGSLLLRLADGTTPQLVLRALAEQPGYQVERFQIALPSLDDIFVRVAQGK
jgi:ABC-2 type transport system ATP-binding protein